MALYIPTPILRFDRLKNGVINSERTSLERKKKLKSLQQGEGWVSTNSERKSSTVEKRVFEIERRPVVLGEKKGKKS
ncbi:hypothetical protein L6452_20935 [Arctium lappa]|uniref:Uncharacterized protein n=1 Tax=Arctium lappa TaxID=4217 RepID=A0ACB9BD83_ARCLA|nr:hypothetical protein L6452_20935 [Arctium lappa]